MDRRSYENVLSDLESENKIKKAEVENLNAEIEKRNQEILQNENLMLALQSKLSQKDIAVKPQINAEESIKTENIDSSDFILSLENEYKENQSKISLVSACEKVLQNEENPLYVTDLIEKLKVYGRFTHRRQLAGAIGKDKRFINLGGNIWDLRLRHPEKEENE